MIEEPESVTEDELSDIVDLYDAEIRYTDAEIDRLLSQARDAWGDVNTLITADHGEEFCDHGNFSHYATFYDEVIHVPFVLDDGSHSGDYEELVGLIDVSPTLVESAGLTAPENFHGESILALFDGEWEREAILGDWMATDRDIERFAYRSHDWKFIEYEDGAELYDLEVDPAERENIADERSEIVAHCRDAIEDHKRRIQQTETDIGDVEMEEDVKERLRQLGYKE